MPSTREQLPEHSGSIDKAWLEQIHQQWVATLDAIRDPIFVVDGQKRIVRMNAAFARMADDSIDRLYLAHLGKILPWMIDCNGDIRRGMIMPYKDHYYHVRDVTTHSDIAGEVFVLENITEQTALATAEEKYLKGTEHALIETVQALVNAIEAKDPHTAAHSQRVARLSRGIALNLGMSDWDAQGIYYGARIHDIGKLSIPIGILSKPGKLAQAEFNLVKMHCETGFSIIKDLTFPWPIHEIVLQHHERLDGSGYPNNLRGDHISREAQIVGVADVVEAIVTHRPYRPALSIEEAVREVQDGRGRLYDPEIVDAITTMVANGAAFQLIGESELPGDSQKETDLSSGTMGLISN